ncbi:MAG: hypothetical protein GY855_11080 [candidate division Zixibacteria bacterium]|nr:hypothetical protein [candidate division Zixibacteria bacterium]
MKKISNQILFSTNVDRYGDKLSKTDLYSLFKQMPDPYVLNYEHDLSLEPVAKAYNKRFKELENGEYAITADVDLYNKKIFSGMGGFSISFKRKPFTVNKSRSGEIEVLFNPRYFNEDDIIPLTKLSNQAIQIDAHELIQKGLEPIPIIIIIFVSLKIATGFFEKAGADLYVHLKKKLLSSVNNCKERFQTEPKFQFHFPGELHKNKFNIVLDVCIEDFESLGNDQRNIENMLGFIESKVGNSIIQKIVVRPIEQHPFWTIKYFVDSDGKVVSI